MSKKKGLIDLAKDFGKVILLLAGCFVALLVFTNVYAAFAK